MTELVAAKELPESLNNRSWPDFELAEPFFDYEEIIAKSGIAGKFYQSLTFIQSKQPGQYYIFEWVILTKEASQASKTKLRKRTRTYAKELNETISKLELPLRVPYILGGSAAVNQVSTSNIISYGV